MFLRKLLKRNTVEGYNWIFTQKKTSTGDFPMLREEAIVVNVTGMKIFIIRSNKLPYEKKQKTEKIG